MSELVSIPCAGELNGGFRGRDETYIFPFRNSSQIYLNLGLCQYIRRGRHVDKEICSRLRQLPNCSIEIKSTAIGLLIAPSFRSQQLDASLPMTFDKPLSRIRHTLHRCLCPCSRQQSHAADHKILKRLIARLPPLAHVGAETWNLRRRVAVIVLEGALEFGRRVNLPRHSLDDVGFVALLLAGGEAS